MLSLLVPGVGMGGGGVAAPIFTGTIPDISLVVGQAATDYDLSGYFSDATSYSISPPVEAGWTFSTSTAVLNVDPLVVGEYGPYTVTATNASGTADSNAFGVSVIESDAYSGGWAFLRTYESELARRRDEERKRQLLEEESERIDVPVDREIALLLREQEAQDAKRSDLERLATIAKQNADIQAAREYSERVAKAFQRAVEKGNYSALEALDREMKRAREEEEFLLLSILMALE